MASAFDTRGGKTMAQRGALRQEPQEALPEAGIAPSLSFAELFETHFEFVWRAAHRLGTPEASLDDVVQETFMVAYRRQESFEGRSSLKTWLYGIVFNVVRAHRRELSAKYPTALHSEQWASPDLLVDGTDGPQESLARREAATFIDGFLQSLNDDQRDVFVLAELEQLSSPEVASVLGVPLNTVYSRLRLARGELAKAIARHRARNERRTP